MLYQMLYYKPTSTGLKASSSQSQICAGANQYNSSEGNVAISVILAKSLASKGVFSSRNLSKI